MTPIARNWVRMLLTFVAMTAASAPLARSGIAAPFLTPPNAAAVAAGSV